MWFVDFEHWDRRLDCRREWNGAFEAMPVHVDTKANCSVEKQLPQDPKAPFDEDPKADASAHPDILNPAPFWHVGGVPMVFENIGFTRNVKVEDDGKNAKQGLKWLICAECDIGKLGSSSPRRDIN